MLAHNAPTSEDALDDSSFIARLEDSVKSANEFGAQLAITSTFGLAVFIVPAVGVSKVGVAIMKVSSSRLMHALGFLFD